MKYICDNDKCKHHTECHENNVDSLAFLAESNGRRVLVSRHAYKDRRGNKFYLCENCHNAVQFAMGTP